MKTVRIAIDREKCVGSGLCAIAAPEVFGQDDDGIVVLLTEWPSPMSHPSVADAVRGCPTAAISTQE
jgi:ferredoxin